MVERGDAAPLLRWAEGPAVSPPRAPVPQAGGRGWGGGGGGWAAAEPPRRREPEELRQPGRLELGDVEEDQVVAVFVVTFDPRSGESRPGSGASVAPQPGFGDGGGGARCARTRTPAPLSPPAAAPAGGQGVPRRAGGVGLCSLRPRGPLSRSVPLPPGGSPAGAPVHSPVCTSRVIEDPVRGHGHASFCFLFGLG